MGVYDIRLIQLKNENCQFASCEDRLLWICELLIIPPNYEEGSLTWDLGFPFQGFFYILRR